MKISKNPFAMLPLLAVLVSCEKAVINTMVLSYSNRRELQETCPAGFTFNTCANCCGYKFTAKTALQTAVTAYSQDKTTAVNTYGEMKCWDVSLITDMSYLFSSKSLNEPIGCWNVGSVTYMYAMFYGATNFNQPIGNWNVGSVTDMDAMFALATNFNQPIGNWNVGSVTTMAFMFYDAAKFNQDLCSWYKKLPPSTTAFTNIFLGTSCPNNAIPDLQVKASFCRTCPTNNGGVQGGTLCCLVDPLIIKNHT
jgi:surface protein